AVGRETLQRITLPQRVVAVDIVDGASIENEEAAIDPPFAGLRLPHDLSATRTFEDDPAEARRRAYRRHRGELSMRLVEAQQRADIEVRNTVAVGHHERLVFAQPPREAPHPAARLRRL